MTSRSILALSTFASFRNCINKKTITMHFRNSFALLQRHYSFCLSFSLSVYVLLSFLLSSSFRCALFTSRYRENHGIRAFVFEFNFMTFGNTSLIRLQTEWRKKTAKKFTECGFFLHRLTLRSNFYNSVALGHRQTVKLSIR